MSVIPPFIISSYSKCFKDKRLETEDCYIIDDHFRGICGLEKDVGRKL